MGNTFATIAARAADAQILNEATSDAFWLGVSTPEEILEQQSDDWSAAMDALIDAAPRDLQELAEKARLVAAAMWEIHGPAGPHPDYALSGHAELIMRLVDALAADTKRLAGVP
jgi:hypothetical protein